MRQKHDSSLGREKHEKENTLISSLNILKRIVCASRDLVIVSIISSIFG